MNQNDYIQLEEGYGAHNYKPLDVVLGRGEGVWVWDVDGHKYLDCLSAYSAVNQGHCHPKIVQTMIDQARKHLTQNSISGRHWLERGYYRVFDRGYSRSRHSIVPDCAFEFSLLVSYSIAERRLRLSNAQDAP